MYNYGKNKLSQSDKEEILSLKGIESSHKVGKKFGVSHTMVCKIWNKLTVNKLETNQFEIDTSILKKMIPIFVSNSLEVDFTEQEVKRIQKLALEVL